MVNYYEVLGVRREASYQEIFKAYRRLAAKYHPDRGGSHEDMVRINEAWYILSDTDRRRVYDKSGSGHTTDPQAEQFREDANDARHYASDYPGTWADFIRFLNAGVKDDVLAAKYNMGGGALGAPTIEGSLSGATAMVLGVLGAYGWLIRLGSYDHIISDGLRPLFQDSYFDGIKMLFAVFVLPLAGGLWLGYWLHLNLRKLVPALADYSSRKQNEGGATKRVLHCEKCKKSLRVPDVSQTLVITCPACGYRFETGGGQRPQKNIAKTDTSKPAQGLILTLAIGVFGLAGVLAGTHKVFFVGFHPADSKDTAQAQYDRLRLIGSWEETSRATAGDLGLADNDAYASVTIAGTSTYERDGSYAFVGKYMFYGSDSDTPMLSISFEQEGKWTMEHASEQRFIHYEIADAQITSYGDNAREAMLLNPASIQGMQQGLFEAWSSEILEWDYSQLRSRDVEFGLETTHRKMLDF